MNVQTQVQGLVWIGQEDSDEYWADGVKADVRVEVTDADEVRIGVHLAGEDTEAAGIYLNRATADKLGRYLAAAAVAEIGVIA